MTRHEQGAHLVLVEDQIDRAAEEAGIDLPPTEKMLKYMDNIIKEREDIEVPEKWKENFDVCRKFPDSYSSYQIGGTGKELDFGLEKVASLIDSMGRSQEKANALDYEVESPEIGHKPEKERERGAEMGF